MRESEPALSRRISASAARFGCDLVTPFQKDATRTPISQGRKRKVAEFGLDALDQSNVISLAAIGEPLEILTCLIALNDRRESACRIASRGFGKTSEGGRAS
jgi:hypothetical protein